LVDTLLPQDQRPPPFLLGGRILSFMSSDFVQAQLKAQEEERQKKDAEEKEAQLERKREERRLKKMVSRVFASCPFVEAH
jgi:hypothetical protein